MKPATRLPLPFLVFALAVFLLPLMVSGSYVIGVMCFVAIYGALALGKGVLLEQAGIFSLAHPTWFGLGAYVTGIAAVKGLPPLAAILLAAAFVALVAFILGAPLLRLKGYYLACATFSLMLIIEIVIANLGSLTGGHDGLMGIPALSVGGLILEGDRAFYYLSWGLCLGTFWFLNNLMHSRMGRAIVSFNDSETASRCLGINVAAYKLRLFVITAILASLAGSLFCFWIRYIMPALFGFPLLVEIDHHDHHRRRENPLRPPAGESGRHVDAGTDSHLPGQSAAGHDGRSGRALFRDHHRGHPYFYARRAGRVAGTVESGRKEVSCADQPVLKAGWR